MTEETQENKLYALRQTIKEQEIALAHFEILTTELMVSNNFYRDAIIFAEHAMRARYDNDAKLDFVRTYGSTSQAGIILELQTALGTEESAFYEKHKREQAFIKVALKAYRQMVESSDPIAEFMSHAYDLESFNKQ